MITVKEIKIAIESLSEEEYNHLQRWFINRAWQKWDQQIEQDSQEGKLDFLMSEALREKEQGELQEL